MANPTVVALYIENVQGPLCSQKGPFWDQTNSFACFLQMGGSISGPEGAGGTKVQFRCNSLRRLDNKYLATTFIPYSFSLAFIKILLFFYNVIIVKSISQISTPGPMHDVLCDHLGPPHLLLTWHQKRFLDKLNPPSLSSSLFGWERCQESPHKFSKLGHCRILRKHTLCT